MEDVSDVDGVEYDPQTDTYRASHDWASPEPLSTTLLATVAAATDDDLLALEPLQETIDVDSVDRLYEPRPGATSRPNGGSLTFTFAECDVTLYWDGTVVVAPE